MRYWWLPAMYLTGCGYVGDPLPPALKIPAPVADLAVAQVGAYLNASFTAPKLTMENLEIGTLGAVEILLSPNWPEGGKTVQVAPGETLAQIPVAEWQGREVTVGVRVANPKGRFSPWSNLVRLRVYPELARPTNVRAEATAQGIEIQWTAKAQESQEWRVLRLGTVHGVADKEAVEMGRVKEARFLDTGAEYGGSYRYSVQGVLGEAVSEISEAATIVPVDRFAPAAPQGLSALAGASAVQLSWERGTEPDIAFYRIYRAVGGGDFAVLVPRQETATFADAGAQAGQTLRYAVTAVDRNNNESPRSQTVEVQVP